MELLTQCPVCGGNKLADYLICKDYTVSHEEFRIQSCEACGFKFTNPRPPQTTIGKYYQAESYISHSNTRQSLIDKVYHQVRSITLQSKLRLVESFGSSKKRMLDIGCGTGYFLKICKEAGWKIAGVEPDDNARKLAVEQTGVAIEQSVLENFANDRFDVITMWHVLEHVHQLNQTIEWLYAKLETEGRLVIAVPNHQSNDAVVFGKYWAAYDVPRHLYHFEKSTMEKLLRKHRFEIESVRPMYFDSFYVSMLSSRYEAGKTNYLKAIWEGLVSNLKARRSNEYSSLIYVIKKS